MSTIRSASVSTARSVPALRPFLVAGLLGGLIALGLNLVLYFVGAALGGGRLLVILPGTAGAAPLPIASVVMLSIAPGLLAGLVFWLLHRATGTPTRWLLVMAVLAYAAFFPGPFAVASGATTAVLQAMHVATAAPILWFLLRVRR